MCQKHPTISWYHQNYQLFNAQLILHTWTEKIDHASKSIYVMTIITKKYTWWKQSILFFVGTIHHRFFYSQWLNEWITSKLYRNHPFQRCDHMIWQKNGIQTLYFISCTSIKPTPKGSNSDWADLRSIMTYRCRCVFGCGLVPFSLGFLKGKCNLCASHTTVLMAFKAVCFIIRQKNLFKGGSKEHKKDPKEKTHKKPNNCTVSIGIPT